MYNRCPCGFSCPTQGGIKRHRKKCLKAIDQARAADDRNRVVELKRAARINDQAKQDDEER